MKSIEELNYFNDPRNGPAPFVPDGAPSKWEICNVCMGNGSVVNPAIDCGGFQPDDSEDIEAYRSGVYDIACRVCSGSGKVKVVDYNRLSPEAQRECDERIEDEACDRAMRRAELMAGC